MPSMLYDNLTGPGSATARRSGVGKGVTTNDRQWRRLRAWGVRCWSSPEAEAVNSGRLLLWLRSPLVWTLACHARSKRVRFPSEPQLFQERQIGEPTHC